MTANHAGGDLPKAEVFSRAAGYTMMKTVTLSVPQWLICTAVALSVVVAAEIRKAVLRRTVAPPGMQVSR